MNVFAGFANCQELITMYYYISIRQLMTNGHKIKCYSLMKNDGIFTIDYLKSDNETEHMQDSSSVSELRDSIPSPDEVLLSSKEKCNIFRGWLHFPIGS